MKIQNYTFCHIPKTGGHSICSLIYNHFPHHKVCSRSNSEKFLFAFVRNPYSRCLSAFNYLKNGGKNEDDKNDSIKYIGDSDFNDFVLNKLEHASNFQQHFRPQIFWIPDGADFIGKYENLKEDIYKLQEIIEMKNCPIPHENKTSYSFCSEVPNHIKDNIYKVYKNDFEYFDYKNSYFT
jgi:hypothetical protein